MKTFFRLLNSGFALLAADGADYVLAFGVQGYESRGIDEPSGENNLTGSHEGFVEVIRTNMSLIRRKIKSPVLVQKLFVLGDKSQTDLCICYMSDRVPKKLIKRIMDSLNKTELESILSTGYIQPFIESGKHRIFSSVGMTERPDVLCSKLIEGRVAILVDGNPYALIIPKLVSDNFQTVDDYNFKPYFGTFIRWLKYGAFFLSVLLPAFYVAVAMHHPELLNSTLLVLLSQSEENAPFSIVAETIGVLIMYEIIKEAGLRLPKAVGGAVSIVAGIIIGDSAVQSGLISTPLLTVAALSVVSGFVIPELTQSITILRIVFVICGGIWGLYGISLLGAAVLFNMCATEDYGFPYTAPFAPFIKKKLWEIQRYGQVSRKCRIMILQWRIFMNRISHSQLFCRFNRNKNVQYYMLCTSVGCRTNGRGSDFNTSSACGSFTYAGSLQTKEFFTEKRNAFRQVRQISLLPVFYFMGLGFLQ